MSSMQRDIGALENTEFDLLVIGGGIYGACIARDAAKRGLNVALVERGDFGGATSHNSLKLIHGGLRYLQHLDIRRLRESAGERRFWLRAAPHLVRPLQFVMPTFGHGTRGPQALWAATRLYGWLTPDRNRGIDPGNRIGNSGLLSRGDLEACVPGLDMQEVNGAAFWYDGQMLDPDRLILEVLRDAADAGTTLANYAQVTTLLEHSRRIHGAVVRDRLGERDLEIRAKTTVCAAGPWIHSLVGRISGRASSLARRPLTKGMNMVTRKLAPDVAFGVRSARASDAVVGSSRRMYFATPLGDCSVIGTSHFPYHGDPDDCVFTEHDMLAFLGEFNAAYPGAGLTAQDVYYWHGGLTPAEEADDGQDVKRSRQAEIVDHRKDEGIEGLISVIGVKYTTARLVAEHAVDLLFRRDARKAPPCRSRDARMPGAPAPGEAADSTALATYGRFAEDVAALRPATAPNEQAADFVACVRYAIEHEMAVRLEDVLLRRTELARRGRLSEALLVSAADTMAAALDWPQARRSGEIDNARRALAARGARLAPD